jgi:Co/Zn/Cd efflux system component
MRNSLKTILFVFAFSPTVFVLAVVRYFTIEAVDTLVLQLFWVAILGTFLPFLIIKMIKKEAEHVSVESGPACQ